MRAIDHDDIRRLPDFKGDIVEVVMALAAATAIRLADKGVLASAMVEDDPGESCLTVTVQGDPTPYYIQPDIPELSEDEEQYIELYIERVGVNWEPFPFQVCIESGDAMLEDIDYMFREIGSWGPATNAR